MQMSWKWSCLSMKWNCGPLCGPVQIMDHSANVKMALITVTPISKQQLDPLVYAWWVTELLRPSHLPAYAPHWVTSSEGCACAMCVSISRVSDLCVIIPHSRKRAGTPTWCPLDEGLGWHLSVSGQPSVAPSISRVDSREPGASLPCIISFTPPCQHLPRTFHAQEHRGMRTQT